jgi:glucan phosphoethanolaminetransferase (alkaline phosphatase superfamily)
MNDLGFDTVSYTACPEVLWNIGDAYRYLGFKSGYYFDDIPVGKDDLAPSKKQISDKALYDKLLHTIDERDRDHNGSSFYWLTTMQNHAPYDYKYNAHLSLISPKNSEVESYLNLVYDSDEAFAELTKHYENSDEHVVIVMFGDHYPHINGFYESFSDDEIGIYQTPFIIWSNRDIESKWIDDISLNYLSNEVFKAAGIPLSPVQQELEHIREYFPIIASFGYKTKDGEWFEKGNSCKYDDILHEYHVLQWYRMFDKKRRILTSSGH